MTDKLVITVFQMSTASQKQIHENREYIKCLIDITLYSGRQGISLRGHKENKESINKVNNKLLKFSFRSLLVIIKF